MEWVETPMSSLRADDRPGVLQRQIVLAEVYAVGPGQHGQVRPVVHDGERGRAGGPAAQAPGPIEQPPVVQRLVAELNCSGAGRGQALGQAVELFRRGPAVQQDLEPHAFKPLAAGSRGVDRSVQRVTLVADVPDLRGHLGVDYFPQFFQAPQRFFQPQKIGGQDTCQIGPLPLGGGGQGGSHVGLGFAGRQALVEGDGGHRGGQIVPQPLAQLAQVAVVQHEPDAVFHHPQPFPGAVGRGVDEANHRRIGRIVLRTAQNGPNS